MGDAHVDETVVGEDGHELVELLGLETQTACEVIVLEAGEGSGEPEDVIGCLHGVANELVEDDGVLGLVEGAGDVLDESVQRRLVVGGGHSKREYSHGGMTSCTSRSLFR